jgi:hypothetical protein
MTRSVDPLALFTLTLVGCGAAVAAITGDARALLARESWLTGVIGLWILASLRAERPFLYHATARVMAEDAARRWDRAWRDEPRLRRTLRQMTIAWGAAFLLDAAARVAMAYTLPVDVVPVASVALLCGLLGIVVWLGRRRGRRWSRGRVRMPASGGDVVGHR